MGNAVKIALSKKKTAILAIGSFVFIFLSVWFFIEPGRFITPVFRNKDFIRISGIVATGFFGICAYFILKKLFSKQYGLVINDNGIIDNSNATSIGLIEWSDIVAVRSLQEFSQKFILIDVKNPEKYIQKKKNRIGKIAMTANYKKYGTPITIISNSLKFDFAKLEKTINREFEKSKRGLSYIKSNS